MPPLRDTLSRRSKTSCNRSYSPLLCRSRKSVSLSWRDGPLSANSIFTPTPPMQKQYGFLTVCKNREMRSFRESALSKVIPLTSGRDSAATAPMSTLLICSSSCVVNFTVNLLRRLIERLPLFGGETQQASTTGMEQIEEDSRPSVLQKLHRRQEEINQREQTCTKPKKRSHGMEL